MVDDRRFDNWLDTLRDDDRERARYLSELPPNLAIARSDLDSRRSITVLRHELQQGFRNLEDKLTAHTRGTRGPSKRVTFAIATLVASAIEAIVQLVPHGPK